jgi:hypothetical protein
MNSKQEVLDKLIHDWDLWYPAGRDRIWYRCSKCKIYKYKYTDFDWGYMTDEEIITFEIPPCKR